MARTFDGVDDQIAFGSEAALDNLAPFTACAYVRITGNVTDERQILTKMNSSYNGKMFIAALGGGGNNNKVIVVVTGSASAYAESVADTLAVDTWCVVVTDWSGSSGGSNYPRIWACQVGGIIAEVAYVSQTAGSGISDDSAATLRIGARDPLDATFFSGGAVECALWNRVLTDDETRALGRGFSPAFFPRGRVFYSPVDGRHSPEINMAGTTHGTVTGTTFLDHPPVIYPRQMGVQVPTVGGSSFKAAWARGSNVVIGSGAR